MGAVFIHIFILESGLNPQPIRARSVSRACSRARSRSKNRQRTPCPPSTSTAQPQKMSRKRSKPLMPVSSERRAEVHAADNTLNKRQKISNSTTTTNPSTINSAEYTKKNFRTLNEELIEIRAVDPISAKQELQKERETLMHIVNQIDEKNQKINIKFREKIKVESDIIKEKINEFRRRFVK